MQKKFCSQLHYLGVSVRLEKSSVNRFGSMHLRKVLAMSGFQSDNTTETALLSVAEALKHME